MLCTRLALTVLLLICSAAECACQHVCSVQILLQAGAAVKEEVVRALLVLLTNAPELHAYVSRQLYAALANTWAEADLSLVVVSTWWLGKIPALFCAWLDLPKWPRAEQCC